ncbi:hypothetical protein ACFJIU_05550 [Mesorhizobium sp. UC74_2]|uniref:hypothetical protein n=1 Tax=Mesorhizobium sp. UC74_2 TaxID=3350171 RepID=UPI00366F8563
MPAFESGQGADDLVHGLSSSFDTECPRTMSHIPQNGRLRARDAIKTAGLLKRNDQRNGCFKSVLARQHTFHRFAFFDAFGFHQ